jgi:hypothetical protein
VPVEKAHMMLYSRDFEYAEDFLFLWMCFEDTDFMFIRARALT